MRYTHFDLLPEKAFQPVGKRMTLEGGGGITKPLSTAASIGMGQSPISAFGSTLGSQVIGDAFGGGGGGGGSGNGVTQDTSYMQQLGINPYPQSNSYMQQLGINPYPQPDRYLQQLGIRPAQPIQTGSAQPTQQPSAVQQSGMVNGTPPGQVNPGPVPMGNPGKPANAPSYLQQLGVNTNPQPDRFMQQLGIRRAEPMGGPLAGGLRGLAAMQRGRR